MRNRSRTAAKLAAVFGSLALMAGLVTLAPSANAAEVAFEYVMLDGSEVTVGDTVFPLFDSANPTSAGLVGVIDDVTGDFEADMTIPDRATTQRVDDPPLPGDISLIIRISADPVVGNVDPATNVVEAATLVDVAMTFEQLVPDANPAAPIVLGITCTMADIPMELSSEPDGENFDPNANPTTFAVADADFEFPLPTCVTDPGGTDALRPTVEQGLIDNLSLPNDDTTAFLTFESGSLTPPTPLPTTTAPPTTATTVAPAATAAQPVRATPRVTG
jgi:hypothetical protein